LLGRGGRGEVHLARDVRLGRLSVEVDGKEPEAGARPVPEP
jgi:hypothetical protein